MKDPILHFLGGFLMAFPIAFTNPWYWPFAMIPIAAALGFIREGTQDSERPNVGYYWQPFPWSGHKWLEAAAWPAGSTVGAIAGIFI